MIAVIIDGCWVLGCLFMTSSDQVLSFFLGQGYCCFFLLAINGIGLQLTQYVYRTVERAMWMNASVSSKCNTSAFPYMLSPYGSEKVNDVFKFVQQRWVDTVPLGS